MVNYFHVIVDLQVVGFMWCRSLTRQREVAGED